MGWPGKPALPGVAAGIRLGVRCLGQGGETGAEACIRRGESVRLERLAPAGLSRPKRGLRQLAGLICLRAPYRHVARRGALADSNANATLYLFC